MWAGLRKTVSDVETLGAQHHATQTRIDELSKDVAQLALLARSLADLCIAGRVLTRDQLAQHMRELEVDAKHIGGGLNLRKAVEELKLRG